MDDDYSDLDDERGWEWTGPDGDPDAGLPVTESNGGYTT